MELKLIGNNGFGKKKYSIAGFMEFEGVDMKTLEHGDSVVDMDGKGRTIYIHECSGDCGTKFGRGAMALVPCFCENCKDSYR